MRKNFCRVCISILLSVIFCAGVLAAEKQSELSLLFSSRKWSEMDSIIKRGNLSAKDRSLAANAYCIQNRRNEVIDMLGDLNGFPNEILPYAKMTLIIALENTGRTSEALKLASELRKNPPYGLGYYVLYAVYRLAPKEEKAVLRTALKEMHAKAGEKAQKIFTLSELIKLSDDPVENSKKLLSLAPSSSVAVRALSSLPKPWNQEVSLLLGYAAYMAKDNKKTIEILASVKNNRKAQYYRAFALYNEKEYADALKLWSELALKGDAYALSSVNRISILSNKEEAPDSVKTSAKSILQKIVETRKGDAQARALYALNLEDRVLREYPSSSFALKIIWKRGMDAWLAGNAKEALSYWQRANTLEVPAAWKARILYWISKAQEKSGDKNAAVKTLNLLLSRYPLSVYTYLARPDALTLTDANANNVPDSLVSQPTLLEQWGFINYAVMLLQRDPKDAKKAFRAAQLAEWLGDDEKVYSAGMALQRFFVKNGTLSRYGLRLMYPRPYRSIVSKAAERFGVEDNLVWSVMRQESAFNPVAKSHAGATGLMQLMPGTAKGEAGLLEMRSVKIWDATDNVTLGTSYLSRQLKAFGDPQRAAAAYNAGPFNARKWNDEAKNLPLDLWIEKIAFDETSDYVQKIIGNLFTYRLIYSNEAETHLALDFSEPLDEPDDEETEAERARGYSGNYVDEIIDPNREP
jgi:soluble lytic murein transglycosylase